jgi:hypothetical protein
MNDRTPWHQTKTSEKIHERLHARALAIIDRNGRRSALRGLESVYRGQRVDGCGKTEIESVSNAVLSVYASLCRAQPATWVLTHNGSIDLQDRAELLTAWLAGVRVKQGTDRLTRRAVLDSIIFGAGLVHTWAGKAGIRQDRVWVGDVGVEQDEEEAGCVQTIYRVRLLDRNAAKRRWPKHASDLESAKNGLAKGDPRDDRLDLVTLVEAYRVSDPESGAVGRRAIVASTCTIVHEDWDSERLPYDVLNFHPLPSQYFGRGLVDAMLAGQSVVELISDKISVSYEKGGGHWFVPQDSGVSEELLTDTPHSIIPIAPGAAPPVFVAVPPISGDYRDEQRAALDRLYQLNGVSQLAASSMVPSGVESGKAMRVYNDTEQAYWYPKSSEFEVFCVEVDRSSIRAAEEIMERGDGAEKTLRVLGIATAGGRSTLRRLGYGEARFDAESMVLQTFPIAKLSTSPSGRIEDVKELVALEVPEGRGDLLQLLGFPDTARYQSLETAGQRLVQLQVLSCLRGDFPELDPAAIDLAYARKHAAQVLALATIEGTDGNLDLLRDYQNQIEGAIKEMEAEAQAKAQAQAQAQAQASPAAGPVGAELDPMGAGMDPGMDPGRPAGL